MARSSENRILKSSDLLYFLTFASGIAAFWASGQVSIHLPAMHSRVASSTIGLLVTGGVYGLGMLILSAVVLRRAPRGIFAAVVSAILLGFIAAQLILRFVAPSLHGPASLGLLTFVLYLVYGAIYVMCLGIGRQFAK